MAKAGGPAKLSTFFAELRPSVVGIHAVSLDAAGRVLAAGGGEQGIACLQPMDTTYLGSGFVYDRGDFAATCAHLFENRFAEPVFAVRFGDGRWCLAELWGASAPADVAVLRLRDGASSGRGSSRKHPRLDAEQELPEQGDWVAVCGATQHGLHPVGLVGMVSQPRQSFRAFLEEAGVHFLQVVLPTLPGMSGSPVVGASGEVVAMLAKKFEEHGLALPVSHVARVARHLEAGGSWRPPVLGLELALGGSVQQPRVVVCDMQRGSAAEAAGVRQGDHLIAVGQTRVTSILEVREVLMAMGGDGQETSSHLGVRLQVWRPEEGRSLELTVAAPLAKPSPMLKPRPPC